MGISYKQAIQEGANMIIGPLPGIRSRICSKSNPGPCPCWR